MVIIALLHGCCQADRLMKSCRQHRNRKRVKRRRLTKIQHPAVFRLGNAFARVMCFTGIRYDANHASRIHLKLRQGSKEPGSSHSTMSRVGSPILAPVTAEQLLTPRTLHMTATPARFDSEVHTTPDGASAICRLVRFNDEKKNPILNALSLRLPVARFSEG